MLGPIITTITHRSGLSFAFARYIAAIVLIAQVTPTLIFAQSDLEPYMVYVDQEGVTARCGPGGDYYRTDPLRHGQALEVYVETPDGWLGIRPPDDSFCWLPADVIKLSPRQDFGVVTEDNALAWIGTHLGKANKYLWQVQLSKGEEVAILGRAKREGPDGIKLWFRIVPPAGEFRWVHRDQVVDNPEMLLRDKPRPGSKLAIGQPTLADESDVFVQDVSRNADSRRNRDEPQSILRADYADEIGDNGLEVQSVATNQPMLPLPIPPIDRSITRDSLNRSESEANDLVIGSGVIPVVNQDAADDQSIATPYEAPLVAFMTRPTVQPIGHRYDSSEPAAGDPTDAFDRRNAPRQTNAIAATVDSRNQDRALVDQSRVVIQSEVMPVSNVSVDSTMSQKSVDGLQLELSRLMSRSAVASELDALLAVALQHSKTNANEADRMRASLLVQRVQQYQEIARRRNGGTARTSLTTPATLPAASLSYPNPIQTNPIQANPVPAAPQSDQSSDASGYLVQVFSSRPDSPPFALTDKQGRTTFYVSPAPGVNLRRFLNQFINVRGVSGYATGLDTHHIIATGALRAPE